MFDFLIGKEPVMRKIRVNPSSRPVRWSLALLFLAFPLLSAKAGEEDKTLLAQKAHSILKANCYRWHGENGAVEGGMNYILDLPRLVARKKVIAGNADASPLFKKIATGKMPPPDEKPRPSPADLAVLKQWI